MRLRNFVSFTLAAAFGLSMIVYASDHISSASAEMAFQQGQRISSCPYTAGEKTMDPALDCPASQAMDCPAISACPGMQKVKPSGECPALYRHRKESAGKTQTRLLNAGSKCPFLSLEKVHRSPYIFIHQAPAKDLEQESRSHEIRI
jgi:hypothetical protein